MERLARFCLMSAALGCAANALAQGLPPVPFPPQNPLTEPKRVLGKILFWEEQLSSDNTVSCGTCHRPGSAGVDPRLGRHPGLDAALNTADDVLGSFGVIRQDENGDYEKDVLFGLQPQVTRRVTPAAIMAMYQPTTFWDGRAGPSFTDPQTGQVLIPTGGALEAQALAPIASDVEKAHEAITWTEVLDKLTNARPMTLATNLPADVAAALADHPTYPDLFAAAFGDGAITAARIAFAIATYERTLLPNQTPWDSFIAGNPNAMTPGQVQGWNFFQNSPCAACHTPPQFTNNTFRNIGLRPIAEDNGRQGVTNNPADRGRFKVPTLRNVGLKNRFMHTGQLADLNAVINFYGNGAAQFPDNRDPIMPVGVPPQVRPALIDFLSNGLRDPRVAAQTFPFDRPTLHSERPPNPLLTATGTAGSGGFVPVMIAVVPPNVGNSGFKIGVDRALGGANAFVLISSNPPVNNVLVPDQTIGPIVLKGSGAGNGYGTFHWPIPADGGLNGDVVFMQWQIQDPAGVGGVARSRVAQLTLFCNNCPATIGDMNCDGVVNILDVNPFILALEDPAGYVAQFPGCNIESGDMNGDGAVDILDINPLVALIGG